MGDALQELCSTGIAADLRETESGRFHAPWNALFRALNVKNEDIDDFARSARDAHVALPDLVIAFFAEVINSKGVASEAIDVEQQS